MPLTPTFSKYEFRDRSGYILTDALLIFGHTAMVHPWADPQLHLHGNSEEYYLLIQGELLLLVVGSEVSCKPGELLVVRPGVPHAIVGGTGDIEHFGFRTLAGQDKQVADAIPNGLPEDAAAERELRKEWGYRIPLTRAENQNCWLLGNGTARFATTFMSFANLNFPTIESANAGVGTRHRLHLHQQSWEYYLSLKGTKTLQIEDEFVTISAGEILAVPPNVRHTLHSREAPYEGFTIRVPCLDRNDKVEC